MMYCNVLEESIPMQGKSLNTVLGKEVLHILFVVNLPQIRYANSSLSVG